MGTDSHARSPGDKRRFDVRLSAVPSVVSSVRDAVGDLGLPPALVDDARLLISELVTNSIQHARLGPHDRVRVRAEWSGTRLRVDVWDRAGTAVPSQLNGVGRPGSGSESGWGLYLVDSVASRWGATPGRYWFELEHDDAG